MRSDIRFKQAEFSACFFCPFPVYVTPSCSVYFFCYNKNMGQGKETGG